MTPANVTGLPTAADPPPAGIPAPPNAAQGPLAVLAGYRECDRGVWVRSFWVGYWLLLSPNECRRYGLSPLERCLDAVRAFRAAEEYARRCM